LEKVSQWKMSNKKTIQDIIQNLRAFYVIIVENDFSYEKNAAAILGKYCLLNQLNRERLNETLISINKPFYDLLISFFEGFQKLPHDEDAKKNLLPEEIGAYLDHIQQKELLSINLVKEINLTLSDEENEALNEALLRNGIFRKNTGEVYNEITREISEEPNTLVAYYKYLPTPSQLDDFTKELKTGVEITKSEFFIAIVDKMLGEGKDENGKAFIENELSGIRKNLNLKFLAILYSSQADEIIPEKYDDYFVRQIRKGSENFIQNIAFYLAQCAYVELFKKIGDDYAKSIASATDLAFQNNQNISYILEKSHEEGIAPLEAIKNWFDLAIGAGYTKLSLENIGFYAALSSCIKESIGVEELVIGEDTERLNEINSYELFDYEVNKKHLPISPGDIFFDGKNYFLLNGQECDICIRQDSSSRKAPIAELLEANFITANIPQKEEKDKVRVDENKISYKHFRNEDGIFGVIEVSLNKYTPMDFAILDLCAYNNDGQCSIGLKTPLSSNLKHLLPKGKVYLYQNLQNKFQKLVKFWNTMNTATAKHLSLEEVLHEFMPNFLNCSYNEKEETVHFKLRRIARLKGNFKYLLIQNYLNYKGRVDLNLIFNSKARSEGLDLEIGTEKFSKNYRKHNFIINGTEVIINRGDLPPEVFDDFDTLKDLDEKIILKDGSGVNCPNTGIKIVRRKQGKIEFTLPFQVYRNGEFIKRIDKDNIALHLIIGEGGEKITTFLCLNENERKNTEKGKISISEVLKGKGIRLEEKAVEIYLQLDKIYIKDIELQ
jgi:hypothetical protein